MPQTPATTKRSQQQIDAIDWLRGRLLPQGAAYPDDVITPEGIRVPLPSPFRRPTTVVGTELAQDVEKLWKVVPELRGRAKVLSPGFTSEMVQALLNQASEPDPVGAEARQKAARARATARDLLSQGAGSNILGMTGVSSKYPDMYIAPGWGDEEISDTLAHEYQHVAQLHRPGHFRVSETEAETTGKAARDLFYPPVSYPPMKGRP